jgi:purine nucleosidase
MPRHLDAIFNFLGCCHSNERNVSPETALFGSAAPSMLRRVPVGPYTNIALAVRKDPRIVERVKKVVTMVGLDLTHQALATPGLQDRVRAIGGPMAKFILDIWEFIATTHGGLLQIEYPAIHDACCVAAMIDGSVVTTEKADIRVELAGRWTKGMTVCNFEKMGGMPEGVTIK